MAVPKDPRGGGDIQAFRQRGQHLADPVGGRLEPVERGIPAGAEGGTAGLAAERLDALGLFVRAVAYQGVDLRVRDAIVGARRVRAGEAAGGHTLRRVTLRLPLAP